jgi:hypothetical protein
METSYPNRGFFVILLFLQARDARRITAAEMKYMIRTAGYTWTDHKTNT